MIFTELTEEEFSSFVEKHPQKNFFETTMMKHKLEKEGVKVYLVGVKQKQKVIAATLLSETPHHFMGKTTFQAYKGFIIDYHNQELLAFMTKEVINFLKQHNVLNLIIDPYIENVSRDKDANIIDGIDNRDICSSLRKLKYKEIKNGEQVKWCYCLDIDNKTSEQLFKEMQSSTRNHINKTINKYKLNIKTLQREELNEFKKITSSTCLRRGFADRTLKYYEDMFDSFKENVTFKICELNCDTYLNNLVEEKNTLEKKINETTTQTKIQNLKENLESIETKINDIEKLKKEDGNIIPLAGAMFMLYGDEVVYLFSGSIEKYMSFCGQYLLQWEMIKYACEHNYQRYNFYGIQDVFNPKGKDRGVYEFKKGFGGHVLELLGSYEIGVSKLYPIYKILQSIKKIIKGGQKWKKTKIYK